MSISIEMEAAAGNAASIASREWIDGYRRAFDILVSAMLAIVTLPIVVFAALGSAIALRAWPLFSQERVGKDGELFRFLKVRTLPTVVPSYIDKHELANYEIPAFCRFLRRRHLDELPQLYLVLAGRMSLIGPRPEMAHLHDSMEHEFGGQRTSVRPGCSGLWQLSESCTGLINAAPEYDRFYIENRSMRLDLWISLRTVMLMVGLGRCITLSDVPPWAQGRTPAEVIGLRGVIGQRDTDAIEPSVCLPATASR